MVRRVLGLVCTALAVAGITAGCGSGAGASPQASCSPADAATSRCLAPTQDASYYADQSSRYFDTLDSSVSPLVEPDYSSLVARWEWPPWLLLTGYGHDGLIVIDAGLRLGGGRIPTRDCRFFPTQPFGRCHVVFDYSGLPCGIYEEFTFDDQGEMTFIEAWSDYPGWLPTADAQDHWAEGSGVHRLSTKVPGLGSSTGTIDLASPSMAEAAASDADVADFVARAGDPWRSILGETLQNLGTDLKAVGCNPPASR